MTHKMLVHEWFEQARNDAGGSSEIAWRAVRNRIACQPARGHAAYKKALRNYKRTKTVC